MCKSLMKAITNGSLQPKACICIRCKEKCKPIEDSIDHEFGSTPFIESDCCGAPVIFKPVKQ